MTNVAHCAQCGSQAILHMNHVSLNGLEMNIHITATVKEHVQLNICNDCGYIFGQWPSVLQPTEEVTTLMPSPSEMAHFSTGVMEFFSIAQVSPTFTRIIPMGNLTGLIKENSSTENSSTENSSTENSSTESVLLTCVGTPIESSPQREYNEQHRLSPFWYGHHW